VFFVFVFNCLYIVDSGLVAFNILFAYYMGGMIPTAAGVAFLAYEVLDSRKAKRPLILRSRRFFGRWCLVFVFAACVLLFFQLFYRVFPDKETVLLAYVIGTFVTLAIVIQLKEFVQMAITGEW